MSKEKLDPELKAKWIAALRSGEYKQAKGVLWDRTNDSYCCHGVLCRVLGKDDEYILANLGMIPNFDGYPEILRPINGLDEGDIGRHLAALNDTGISFNEIANWIEENL